MPAGIAAFALAASGLAQVAPAPAGAQPADPARGLWIGPIHACRDTAGSNAAGPKDDPFAGLIIILQPKLRAILRRETARLVGTAMPIRLDGKLISAPIVLEPITGGALSLSGPADERANAIQAAIRRPC